MKPGNLRLLGTVLVLISAGRPVRAETFLDREFSFDPARVRITQVGGVLQVSVPGGAREFRAGRPDLPWISERIELPVGVRIRAVDVLSLDSRLLADGGRLPSAIRPTPGLGSVERTEPDRVLFAHHGFLPDPAAELGAEGFERGVNVALVNLSPVRWDPATGRLEALTRVRVRLALEPTDARPLARERVVDEWESPRGPARSVPAGRVAPAGGRRVAEPLKATQIPSIMGSPVAYVIITNETMQPEFQRLADWKTESGVPATVRTLTFIRQQYPGAADDAERIRSFIRDAYSRWGTKWVLLGGDTDVLPTRFGYTTFYNGNFIATDLYFQCLDGNWDLNGDQLFGEGYVSAEDLGDDADLMPEVYVGRAPCTTLAQAQLFVNKTLRYEKTPISDYMKNVLLFAEVLFPQDWEYPEPVDLDGGAIAELVLPYLQSNPHIHPVRLYENYTNPDWKPGALPETREAVLDSLDRGYNVAVHVGHGYRNVMHCGDGTIDNSDAYSLTNGDRLINLYAINCTSNAIDYPSIGEAFLLSPTGGAVTNVGSTHFDYPTAGQVYEDEYFRLMFEDSVTAVGEAHARSKLPAIGYALYDGVHRWTQMTLLMLGDPELRVFTNTPRILAVTKPATMSAGDTAFSVHVETGGAPLYGARVTAYSAGMDYCVKTTDGAGNTVLPFRPDSVGSFKLTVVAFDCVPYQATIPLTAPSPPTLSTGVVVIDDDDIDGTSGNANGIVDAGETVELKISLRNNGGSTAPTVNGTLTSTDPEVSITTPSCAYGTIAAGGSSSPSSGFRVHVQSDAGDQREVPFNLVFVDSNNRSYRARFQIVVRAPELKHLSHSLVDQGGNSNGKPDPGETIVYYVKLRDVGTGGARGVTGKLRNFDGLATVMDSTSSWGTIAPNQEVQGDAFVFTLTDVAAGLQLQVTDQEGTTTTQALDLTTPGVPLDVAASGGATTIALHWSANAESDLTGYNCYRSLSQSGPFTKVNPVPTGRIARFDDSGLSPLTRYYYKVSAVDSSANESALSPVISTSTNPPAHTVFPITMGRETPSSVAVDHVYSGYPVDIVAGADVLYMLHPDGTAPVDADGAGTSHGDFTRRGVYYAAGPSIADLDGGGPEIIGLSWGTNSTDPGAPGDSMMVVVFDKSGQMKPGWPQPTLNSVWSSAACGDVDGAGQKEIVFGSNGDKIYAFHADGTELMDGDSNPTTKGVFKVVGGGYNFSTPAIADLDHDGKNDIIYGATDGYLYAWHANGTNVPGFPVYTSAGISGSPAVGYLDGPSDTQLDVVIGSGDSLFVFRADGSRRPNFPQWIKFSGTSKAPSPALADMNNDGFLDIVVASTNGGIYVKDRVGFTVIPWQNIRYSTKTSFASESSPVVADIDGDGKPDILMGDENGNLAALSGATATMLPGFPIVLNGEVRGTPALCDCDGDGKSEIVLADWDRNLYMWDYDFPFSPGKVPPWPQFHHDAARTGLASNPVFVDVGDTPLPPAGSWSLEFSPPSPNPARSSAHAIYTVAASSAGAPYEIAVYDVSGRRLRMLERGTARAGSFTASWDLRAADGRPVGEGLYFMRITLGSLMQSRKVAVVH